MREDTDTSTARIAAQLFLMVLLTGFWVTVVLVL